MSEASQKIPDSEPIMVAWRAWMDTPEVSLSAGHSPDSPMLGRIWLAFMAGWKATGKPVISSASEPDRLATLTAENERMRTALADLRPLFAIYDRVHKELEDGKKYKDIDNGLINGGEKASYEYWQDYMSGRIVLAARSALSEKE